MHDAHGLDLTAFALLVVFAAVMGFPWLGVVQISYALAFPPGGQPQPAA